MIELWNVSRALGLVALLLTGVVLALGALHNTSLTKIVGQALPRFVLVALHRNLALITVVFVLLHVVAVLVTPYLPLRWYHLLVPFTATFNPWPVALGAISFDLLLAVVISSSLRKYLSKRAWLVVHWTSYVCFPVAVAHAVANASFRGGTWWTLLVPLVATGLVVAALLYRRAARRRPALPLADRGRTDPAEARRAADVATGSQPIVRVDGPDTPPAPSAPAPRAGEDRDAADDSLAAPGEGAGEGGPGDTPARRGVFRELRVVAGPEARAREGEGEQGSPERRGRHSADPDDDAGADAGADAQTDTLAGTEAPTVALPPRPRRR
ncbi:ferric reductase-like transmembrane domain-containing protein [Actinomycetospora lutea]|uniref:ferric reductase-like transmembrane domain-containing protein n=1 Tax=Actinomycetospora lutea TaxID=663604 RepID=UPI00236551C5|nr:ferric reductase-like transmembrane domain-containing protein [Actinomycetospora lutea]MDD7937083.1 ferric reductase-like transmembrane domain-containing protein [Actinomycetospora lutea]